MAALDPRIEEVRVRYGLAKEDFWELPQKKGTWIAKHAALEVAAVKAGIVFSAPLVLEANGEAKSAALCVTGTMGDRSEWSVGEASPANNKNAYPFAMAEKRVKDRVILKLIGIHGLAYSEDEADDFKPPPANATKPAPAIPGRGQQYDDPDGQMQNWINSQQTHLTNCSTLAEVQEWEELRADHMKRLHSKNLPAWGKLVAFKEARIRELQPKGEKA